jgi:hypothetical protein
MVSSANTSSGTSGENTINAIAVSVSLLVQATALRKKLYDSQHEVHELRAQLADLSHTHDHVAAVRLRLLELLQGC